MPGWGWVKWLIAGPSAFVVGLLLWLAWNDARRWVRYGLRVFGAYAMAWLGVAGVLLVVLRGVVVDPFGPETFWGWAYIVSLLLAAAGFLGVVVEERALGRRGGGEDR